MAPESNNNPLMVAQQGPSSGALADSTFTRSAYYANGAVAPESGTPARGHGAVTFAGLSRAFVRRWPLALGAALAGAGLVVLGVLVLMPLRYNASARFFISARNEAPAVEGAGENIDFNVLKSNQAGLVKSPAVLKKALEDKTAKGKDVRDLSIVRGQSDPAAWLESALKTDFPSPEILRATLSADDAEEAAELLNAVVRGVLKMNDERDEFEREKLVKDLGHKKDELEADLGVKRAQLHVLARPFDEKGREEAYKTALEMVKDAKKTQRMNQIDLEVAREELKGFMIRIKTIDTFPVPADRLDEVLRNDPTGAAILASLKKVQEEMAEIELKTAPALVPVLKRQKAAERDFWLKQLASARERDRPELEARFREAEVGRMKMLMIEVEQKIAKHERLDGAFLGEVARMEAAARKLTPANTPLPAEVENLKREVASGEAVLDQLNKTIKSAKVKLPSGRVQVQSWANEPTGKDFSRQAKFAGAGGFGLFILILVGVAYLEFRAQKVGDSEDLAHSGINLVGTIPDLPLSARRPSATGVSVKDAFLQNQLGESVDSIRTLLLHVSRTDSLRVLMVTSAAGGEGKTSLASQLAASLARAWRKTLLIDADLRHPAGHALFDLPLEPGFSEVLRNEVKPADAIKPTPLSRLWLMPAGHWDAHAVQALAQDNVRPLLEQLKQQYDYIIIDSCPVLPVADSLVLGQHVDGVVFSVLRDVSRLPALHAAHQKMTNLGIRTLGAVVIGAKADTTTAAYKYAAAT
jgi:succinoglycan biosynthesis transport protein ExoP